MTFKDKIKELEGKIQNAYTEGITLDQAERLAGEFLGAQLMVSAELTKADLDSRTRRSGSKAVRAAVYLNIVQTADGKKPTEAQISAMIETNETVNIEQDGYDRADVSKLELERYYDIFREAHIYFRGVAKGVQS